MKKVRSELTKESKMAYKALYDFQKLSANSKFVGVHLDVVYKLCLHSVVLPDYSLVVVCFASITLSLLKLTCLSFSSSISFLVNSENSTIFCHETLYLLKLSENYLNIKQIG